MISQDLFKGQYTKNNSYKAYFEKDMKSLQFRNLCSWIRVCSTYWLSVNLIIKGVQNSITWFFVELVTSIIPHNSPDYHFKIWPGGSRKNKKFYHNKRSPYIRPPGIIIHLKNEDPILLKGFFISTFIIKAIYIWILYYEYVRWNENPFYYIYVRVLV